MSEMIERAARAMFLTQPRDGWSQAEEDRLEQCRVMFRAAIEEMRKPTREMARAGNDFTENQAPEVFYRAMIDAALK